MSLRLDCALGLFKSNIVAPRLPLRFAGHGLEFFLERASRVPGGIPGIQMRMANAYTPSAVRPASSPTDLLALQVSLASMLQNPVNGSRISRVGVIYADRMQSHGELFGLMFDGGFPGSGVPNAFTGVPREGCAVFLSAISNRRPDPQDFVLETLFTTAHELSHVFNLWHVPDLSFLKTSDIHVPPFGVEAYGYVDDHSEFLRNMDRPEVFPGGTPFGVRGIFGPAEGNSTNPPVSNRVRLSVSMTVREFWRFEPVEFDVRVSSASRRPAARPIVLPDFIDPGYEYLNLWVTEPDGRRRRYRAPALYCMNSGTIKVWTAKPYERDIPVFGQSRGYTFRKAGVHRLVATLRLPSGGIVHSNELEVLVKQERPRSAEYRRAHDALTHRPTAQLLFYKSAKHPRRVVEQAIAQSAGVKSPFTRAATRYASGIALLRRPTSHRPWARVANDKRFGVSLLKAALDSGRLGAHRERKAAEWVDRWGG